MEDEEDYYDEEE